MGSDNREQIVKDVFQFTSARYITQGIGFFTAIVIRKFLGPFYMGIWSLFRVVLNYCLYFLLGVDQGMMYKIPICVGQNDKKAEENIRDTAFSFIFLISILISIGLLIAAIILKRKYPAEVIISLCALSIYNLLEKIYGYYQLLLRAKRNFSVLSMSLIFDAAANLVLIYLIVRNFKLYGLYITAMLVAILNTFFMHAFVRYKVNFTFKLKESLNLIKIGFPITIVGLLQWILSSLDRIMIAKMIGITAVGYYSIPIMAKNYISQLSGFGTVLYPRLLETYGKRQKIEDIKKYAIVPPIVNAYTLPAILGLVFFITPLLIEKILPKFIPGILAMQILLVDMFFLSCCTQAYHFIYVMKKQIRIIPFIVVAIILSIIFNYILINKGYGIYGVAWATSFVTFMLFIALQSYAMKHFANIKEIFLFFLKIMIPPIYIGVVIFALENLITIENMYIETAIKCTIILICSIPIFIYINKETKLISLLLNMIKKKILSKIHKLN